MKKLLFFTTAFTFFFSACVEVPPTIDFSVPTVPLQDSTYVASTPPLPQHKMVLIEDVTGVRCINCPDAAMKANDIINQKSNDSVVVLAQYPIGVLSNFTTPWPGVPQLANEISKQIVEALGTPQGLPTGYVDRKAFNGPTSTRDVSYNEWIGRVNQRLREKTPVNISLSKVVNNRNLKVSIKLEYNTAVTGNPHKYAIYLMESGIVSTQLDHSGENKNYVHNHALRYAFGLAMGDPLTGPYDAGRTYLKQFEYEIPAEYVISNCHVVCVVLDGITQEVINVREIDL